MTDVDDYITSVQQLGGEGSKILRAVTAETLKNSDLVRIVSEGMRGVAVLDIPKDYHVVVHCAGGDPSLSDIRQYSESLVDRLVQQAENIGVQPVGFADVVDSATGDLDMITTIAEALRDRSNHHKLAVLNGENAVLGPRVSVDANLTGVMISITKNPDLLQHNITANKENNFAGSLSGIQYAVFDPKGMPVFINADGIGTKTEFYERRSFWGESYYFKGIMDFFAMNMDDASKLGAACMAIAGLIERKGDIPTIGMANYAIEIAMEMGVLSIMPSELMESRISSYRPDIAAYNISGSVVSVIDEERLANPLVPIPGNILVALQSRTPNPRSNGISKLRAAMTDYLGNEWHKEPVGKEFIGYLGTPSTVFYPVFKEMIVAGAAAAVYHMSGGAFDEKLAVPLANANLYVELNELFRPDWRQLALAGANLVSAYDAYGMWHMGNEAFVATSDPIAVEKIAEKHGLNSRPVGEIEQCRDQKIGVCVNTPMGHKLHYSGLEE
ncbi:MAG: hypothetical protein V1740_06680 [Candidatus Woesearchaeota archaeon]